MHILALLSGIAMIAGLIMVVSFMALAVYSTTDAERKFCLKMSVVGIAAAVIGSIGLFLILPSAV